jgi:hypothetical protein
MYFTIPSPSNDSQSFSLGLASILRYSHSLIQRFILLFSFKILIFSCDDRVIVLFAAIDLYW